MKAKPNFCFTHRKMPLASMHVKTDSDPRQSDEEPMPKRVKFELESEAEASDEHEIEEGLSSSNEEGIDSPANDFKEWANLVFNDILECIGDNIELHKDRMKTLKKKKQHHLADCNISDKQDDKKKIENMFQLTLSACNRLQSLQIEMQNQLTVDQEALQEIEM